MKTIEQTRQELFEVREIERLKEGQDSLILVRDDYKSQVNEYRELWAKAAIKANPSVVVGMLRDTLELWLADYEAVASNPDFEPFPHVADLAAKTRDALAEVARLNSSPASASDERVDVACCAVCGSDRAALSANHSEQVPDGLPAALFNALETYKEKHDLFEGKDKTTHSDQCELIRKHAASLLAAAPSAGSQKEQG